MVEEYLEDYNSVSNAPMRLVMFLDAIEHVSRITRVIRLPLGNALLLGVGGSGRQSLTRLAAFMEVRSGENLVQLNESMVVLLLWMDVVDSPDAHHVSGQSVLACTLTEAPVATAQLVKCWHAGMYSAWLQEYDTFQIEIAKGYGPHEWREDLKKVSAGADSGRCRVWALQLPDN